MVASQTQLEKTRAHALRQVSLDLIRIRKQHNFRTDFDEASLQDLAESIRAKGILQPLVLRYVSSSKAAPGLAYELVAGERRLRAAKIAGLKEVPAMVRELSDAEADEIMVIENLQRQDLSDLEYAEGFNRLIKTHGYTVDQLAQKAHKGTTFIRDLLHLVNLPSCARDGLLKGRITKSVGVLISTIPDQSQREKFANEVLRGNTHGNYDRGSALTFREAKEWKEKAYMKVLSGAPFSLDEALDPAWPHSCRTCPHFAGNSTNGDSKQGKRSDVCLNPPHYEKLVQLSTKRKIEAAASRGGATLSFSETKEVFSEDYEGRYRLDYNQKKYIDLQSTFFDYSKKSTPPVPWSLVAKAAGIKPIIAVTPDAKEHRLVATSEIEAAAKQQGYKTSFSSNSSRAKPSLSEEKRKALSKCRDSAARAVVQKALETKWPSASIGLWKAVVKNALDLVQMGDGGEEIVAELLGAVPPKKQRFRSVETFLEKHLASLQSVTSLQAMLAALLIADRLSSCTGEFASDFNKDDLALCKAFGVDVKRIEQAELKRLAAETKTKKKTAKRAKKVS